MTARFTSNLVVEQLTEANTNDLATWKLMAPFGFESGLYALTVTAPAGFITDFASVPRVPICFEIDGDIAQDCAVIHDYCYATGCVMRVQADLLLEEMMTLRNFSPLQVQSIFLAVRAFGASHYTATPHPELMSVVEG